MSDTKKPSPEVREKAWRDIMRLVETPKWRGPVSMAPEEEKEAMIFAIVEETRHEMAEERRRARERKSEDRP